MLSICVTILIAIFTVVSPAEHDEHIAIADISSLPSTALSNQFPDQIASLLLGEGDVVDQDPQILRERDPNFGWYSHEYKLNNLVQWTFGNGTQDLNISISTCVKKSQVVGVYQFMNGSNSTEATFGDIYSDLGYESTLNIPETMINHTLINAEAAYNEISTFLLDSILCVNSPTFRDELRRQLLADNFVSNGRIATLILQTASTAVIYYGWNGLGLYLQRDDLKFILGGIATCNIVFVLGLLEIFRQEDLIQPYEAAFVGSVFVAKARSLILRATQDERVIGGACLPVTELAGAAAHAGSGAAPVQDLGVLAGADVDPIQAACANPN